MIFIEELRVHSVELPHALGKIVLGRLDEEVVMVDHKATGVADPVISFVDVLKGIEKCFLILIFLEDRFFLIPTGSSMVDSSGVFYAERRDMWQE